MERDKQNFLSFWTIFYPPNNPKNQSFERMKKALGDIIISHKCTKNHDHMLHCSKIQCMIDVIFIFQFGLFLPF